MGTDWNALARRVKQQGAKLYGDSPVMESFAQLASAATVDAALSKKTKELIAVAISISQGCESCIAYHTLAAIKAGATREECLEVIGVAIEMGGGPATVYGAQALEAFDALQ
jgi:AhpD family alkylhydroperoxidase